MRTEILFNDIDASADATSAVLDVPCAQDMRFIIQVFKTGVDANPIIEVWEGLSKTGTWTPMQDNVTWEDEFIIDRDSFPIKDSYFMGDQLRLEYKANGVTTGTIKVVIGYKTKP